MGVYINNKIIYENMKKEDDELTIANIMLELAKKEMEIQQLAFENANIMLELAMLKGGI